MAAAARAPPGGAGGGGGGDDAANAPCDFNTSNALKVAASTPLGKAIKPNSEVLICRRNCGQFQDPFTGKVYDRAAKEVPDSCPRADRDQLASSPKKASAGETSVGLPGHLLQYWSWSLEDTRDILECILAPSTASLVAAEAALDAMKKAAKGTAKAGPTDSAVSGDAKFNDLLRFVSPFNSTHNLLPRAASIAAYLAAVDYNATADAANRITVLPGKIRRDETGDPLRLESVIGVQALKVLIDAGRTWFRELVDAMCSEHEDDPVHFVKVGAGQTAGRDSKVVVWPLRWGITLLKSWNFYISKRPVDAVIPGLIATLRASPAIVLTAVIVQYNALSLFARGGALSLATLSNPRNAKVSSAKDALDTHARHIASLYYDKFINTKAMIDDYKAATKAGATVIGLRKKADQPHQQDRRPKPPARGPSSANAGSGSGGTSTAAATAAGAAVAAPTSTSVYSPTTTWRAPRTSTQTTSAPLPALPPAPATAPSTAAAQSSASPSSRPNPPTGRTTFSKCMAPNCTRAPPSGSSTAPFCRACGPGFIYDWNTGAVTPR